MNQNTESSNIIETDFMADFYNMLKKGMSWAEICYELDEEEERQEKEAKQKDLEEKMLERRRLYAIGEYELEEGEILE